MNLRIRIKYLKLWNPELMWKSGLTLYLLSLVLAIAACSEGNKHPEQNSIDEPNNTLSDEGTGSQKISQLVFAYGYDGKTDGSPSAHQTVTGWAPSSGDVNVNMSGYNQVSDECSGESSQASLGIPEDNPLEEDMLRNSRYLYLGESLPVTTNYGQVSSIPLVDTVNDAGTADGLRYEYNIDRKYSPETSYFIELSGELSDWPNLVELKAHGLFGIALSQSEDNLILQWPIESSYSHIKIILLALFTKQSSDGNILDFERVDCLLSNDGRFQFSKEQSKSILSSTSGGIILIKFGIDREITNGIQVLTSRAVGDNLSWSIQNTIPIQ